MPTNVENYFSECTLSFELTQNGQPFDPQLFSIDADGRIIQVNSQNSNLNGLIYNMVLTVTQSSGASIIDSFKVTMEDRCNSATLTGSQFFD